MGSFFLYHRNSQIKKEAVDTIYSQMGFKNPFDMALGDYNLILYNKQKINDNNYYKLNGNWIFVTGSLIYKGLSYKHSIVILLRDFIESRIIAHEIFGNYTIIFFDEKRKLITFSIDPAFIKNVYFDPHRKIITTDFLALIESNTSFYTANKLALLENLTSGHLISPDTYVNEIFKLDKININEIEMNFPGLLVNIFSPALSDNIDSFCTAIDDAQIKLSEYFEAIRSISDEYGTHIGITGGFDSRLLLMFAKKYLNRVVTNSFWREKSIDYLNAKELATVANVAFYSYENRSFRKPEKELMLEKSYYFFDGQIRSQNKWEEEFSSPDYISGIIADHMVGLHGCGGEQYRNADRLSGEISLKNYILYDWMFKQCPDVFTNIDLREMVFANIKRKMLRILQRNCDKISLYELKRIQNEIWNTANRVTRINALNRMMFYFAPFTEYYISHSAYKYVPYLGDSYNFQKELMGKLDPVMAGVKTNYGFTILEKESLKYKLIPCIYNAIPRSIFSKLYFRMKDYQKNMANWSDFERIADPVFLELTDGLDLNKLIKNVNLGNSLYSFNYLINKISHRVSA